MGVTIHYQLSSDATGVRQARQLVAQLRQHALDVPFQQVDDVIELMGNECNFQQYDDQYPHRWLLIQARQLVPDTREVEHR